MNVVCTRFPYQSAYGGEEYHTLDVCKYFAAQGHNVSFFGSCRVLNDLFTKEDFTTRYVPYLFAPVTPVTLILFIGLLPIHALYLVAAFLLFSKAKPVTLYALSLSDKLLLTPIVLLTGGSAIWLEHQYLGRWIQKSPLRYWYSLLGRFVTIVPISNQNSLVLLDALKIPTKNIVAITHGIATEEYIPDKKRLGSCVYSGRLEPEKGIEELLQAFLLVRNKLPEATLTLRGKGSLLGVIESFITEHNLQDSLIVQNPTSKTEYSSLLAQSEVAILASKDFSETFSLFMAEAICSGCKPVVSHFAGITSTLTPEHSFIVDVITPQKLCEQILAALRSKVQPDTLHEFAKTTYNQKQMLESYEQLL